MKTFYQMTKEEVRQQVNGYQESIRPEDVEAHQKKYGKNELAEGKQKKPIQIFLEQFKDFLVIILIISAIISGFLGDLESTAVILIVITINAILGTVQTLKAESSLKSLKKLSAPETKVVRNGGVKVIPVSEVTIGDEVILEAGDYVPADGRILDCASLKIDESALTGESVSVEKEDCLIEGTAPLGDQKNMVFSGGFVTYGRGSFLVTSIGMDTEVGKIARLLANTADKRTPLQRNLDQFGKNLSILILVFCAVLFGVNVIKGEDIGNAFMFAIALAVAAIPEALSSIVTIVLAFGTQKMAREHAVIRKLQAVEGLGSVSVICSDKTGTLTKNEMTIEQYYIGGETFAAENLLECPKGERFLKYSLLCNDASIQDGVEIGDPTETAFVKAGEQNGIYTGPLREGTPRIGEVPFDSDRKLMSTVHEIDGKQYIITKGAVDVLVGRSLMIETVSGAEPMTETWRNKIFDKNMAFAGEGLRVLAVGYREIDRAQIGTEDEKDYIFLGMAAMMDPPRDESKPAVEECIAAGIKPVMITGDHKITAAAIAKRIGILKEDCEACEGMEIEHMSDKELEDFVEHISVYARVSPEHKIRIVKAWQNKGNIVAMTGDGVNDAPALKQADVGVAMGITGTEVSKDAAAMILTDDNFATIIKAVENGRNVYQNIKHSIQFLLSGNFGAILMVLFAALLSLPVPFEPVHLLFINLLTDSLPAIALGLEPHVHDVMRQKPRRANESILTKSFLARIGVQGAVICILTGVSFMIGLETSAKLASTMAFGTLCMARLVHGFNCKSDKRVLFKKQFYNNIYLFGAFAIGFVLISAVLLIPVFAPVMQVATLTLKQYGIICLMALMNLVVVQLLKGEGKAWI